ncbi:Ig-like domain-containing protein [Sporosarcina sp. SAFN-015]|uniref:Ig-like domain-containing protein n=1 Tax=Sporosarcina sp. SAFN-015 TaxID=3387274 RepID=UPI003F7FD77C
MKKITIVVLSILFAFTITASSHAVSFTSESTHDPEKPWTISFSQKIDSESMGPDHVYITTPSGENHPVSLTISDDLEKIIVKPEKRYAIGTNYRLTVSKSVTSAEGKPLKEDVVKDFIYTGIYIHVIQAELNPLATNVKVQTEATVTSLTISVNGGVEQPMIGSGKTSFSRGIQGLAAGDELFIKAYDKNGKLLEEQVFEVTE